MWKTILNIFNVDDTSSAIKETYQFSQKSNKIALPKFNQQMYLGKFIRIEHLFELEYFVNSEVHIREIAKLVVIKWYKINDLS